MAEVLIDNIVKRAVAYKPKERVTYKMIKGYMEAKYGFKVHTAYIAEVKEKCGVKERENYNNPKSDSSKKLICPAEKEEAIKDAFKYYKMI